jgi:hypothetical protein
MTLIRRWRCSGNQSFAGYHALNVVVPAAFNIPCRANGADAKNVPKSLRLFGVLESDPIAKLDARLDPTCEQPILRPQVHLYEHRHADQGNSVDQVS